MSGDDGVSAGGSGEAKPAIADPIGDRVAVECQFPAIDLGAPMERGSVVLGWAYSPRGIERVELTVDGVLRVPLSHGRYRPDVARRIGVDDAEIGFARFLSTAGWDPGEYAVSIAATDRDGRVARHSGTVVTSPHQPYRAWRERTGGLAAGGPRGSPGPLIHADGRDLRQPLSGLASAGRGHLVLASPEGALSPGARERLGGEFRELGGADVVYADEDAIVEDGRPGAEFLKPGWSPELLLSLDYIGPLLAIGPRAAGAALDAAAGPLTTIYEVALALIDAPLRIVRLPAVMFTAPRARWAADDERVRQSIEAVGRRRGFTPRVESAGAPGARHVGWEIAGDPRVSVVIPTAFMGGMVERCLDSIAERSTWPNLEIVLVDTSDGDGFAGSRVGLDVTVVECDGEFNFSRACNAGARAAGGDFLLFLNDDTEVLSRDWIERMLEHAQLPGAGPVGAKLLFPDGSIQHGGVNLVPGALGAAHEFALVPGTEGGYRGMARLTRNCSAVTAACLMIEAELFRELDGFDEGIAIVYGDVDLCLRAIEARRRVVWAARAELIHHEASSRPMEPSSVDERQFTARWRDRYRCGDPLYHPAFLTYPTFEYPPASLPMIRTPAHSSSGAEQERPSPERFTPGSIARGHLIEAEHEARYRWAAQTVNGREVLDAGCGAGYGSATLAAAGARRIVGVDRSAEAIETASRDHGRDAEFRVAELQELPFDSGCFDIVVCFEVIEHVPDPDRALDEIRRVLRENGLLLISSPNRGVYLPGNPWHVHEYRPAELEQALARRFANVKLFRQEPNLASSIADDRAFATDSPAAPIRAGVRRVIAGVPGRETYTLAAASDAVLPNLDAEVVITEPLDVAALSHQALDASRRAQKAEAENQALRDALDEIKRSPSWRVTAPLRGLKRALWRPSRRSRG